MDFDDIHESYIRILNLYQNILSPSQSTLVSKSMMNQALINSLDMINSNSIHIGEIMRARGEGKVEELDEVSSSMIVPYNFDNDDQVQNIIEDNRRIIAAMFEFSSYFLDDTEPDNFELIKEIFIVNYFPKDILEKHKYEINFYVDEDIDSEFVRMYGNIETKTVTISQILPEEDFLRERVSFDTLGFQTLHKLLITVLEILEIECQKIVETYAKLSNINRNRRWRDYFRSWLSFFRNLSTMKKMHEKYNDLFNQINGLKIRLGQNARDLKMCHGIIDKMNNNIENCSLSSEIMDNYISLIREKTNIETFQNIMKES